MGGIFWLSSVPGDQLPLPQFPFSDKLAHLVTYGVLGALIAFRVGLTASVRTALPGRSVHPVHPDPAHPDVAPSTPPQASLSPQNSSSSLPPPHALPLATTLTKGGWIAPAVGIAYAALDEFHQGFVPNRTLSFGDFTTDVVGILAGFWLARRWDAARLRKLRAS